MSGARILSDSGLSSVYQNAFVLALLVGGGLLAMGLARLIVSRWARSRRPSSALFTLLHAMFIVAGLSLMGTAMALTPLRARAQRTSRSPEHAEPAALRLTSDNSQVSELQSPK